MTSLGKMSQQLSVCSFFRKPNNDDAVDKRGEKRGTDAVEDEEQTSNQPSTTTEQAAARKLGGRVQWEQSHLRHLITHKQVLNSGPCGPGGSCETGHSMESVHFLTAIV
ncbi:hypothetical protein GOODEAATRI_027286 [Goodea atripinnis]|uniref:Uncharacterized protein n=1 Tax=Goodea atripinnis TaxID=208336 RepID=A0ABV0NE02_9TELE